MYATRETESSISWLRSWTSSLGMWPPIRQPLSGWALRAGMGMGIFKRGDGRNSDFRTETAGESSSSSSSKAAMVEISTVLYSCRVKGVCIDIVMQLRHVFPGRATGDRCDWKRVTPTFWAPSAGFHPVAACLSRLARSLAHNNNKSQDLALQPHAPASLSAPTHTHTTTHTLVQTIIPARRRPSSCGAPRREPGSRRPPVLGGRRWFTVVKRRRTQELLSGGRAKRRWVLGGLVQLLAQSAIHPKKRDATLENLAAKQRSSSSRMGNLAES